ncbi:hypothetical protein BJY04DRAFT_200065 [Aspergillus karnatakaensis]|uniref:DUF2855 family protein n=1 Tax=Aspergillus karnatakaensis TaxID=1810916 RepID=UPI003CCE0896
MSTHVISKANNGEHTTISLSDPSTPLAESSIRVRPALLGLTSNNLTYALAGTTLHWWDAYPVPSPAPAPYNDQTNWGIVPAWGLATILESTIPSLTPSTTLWGFWPTSSTAVDLQLTPSAPAGHWTETSPHRQSLFSLYNHYFVFDTASKDLKEFAWDAVVRPVWAAGYILSDYIFTPDAKTNPPAHPLHESFPWTLEDADISKAVFVSVSASGKTARATAYNFFCRPPGAGPKGFLQITSSPAALAEAAEKFLPSFPVKAIAYEDVHSADGWIADQKPDKIVVADFGARDEALQRVVDGIKTKSELKDVKLVIMAVGNQQKVYTASEVQASQEAFAALNKVQMNTSGVVDTILKAQDPSVFYDGIQKRWDQWVQNREFAAPDLKLVWGEGIVGEKGIEGGWDALTSSKVKPEEALVYML